MGPIGIVRRDESGCANLMSPRLGVVQRFMFGCTVEMADSAFAKLSSRLRMPGDGMKPPRRLAHGASRHLGA